MYLNCCTSWYNDELDPTKPIQKRFPLSIPNQFVFHIHKLLSIYLNQNKRNGNKSYKHLNTIGILYIYDNNQNNISKWFVYIHISIKYKKKKNKLFNLHVTKKLNYNNFTAWMI